MMESIAAEKVLQFIYERVPSLKTSPPDPVRQFAAAGLMRCCLILRGLLALDQAHLAQLGGILARQHWETWLVSLYVLLGGDAALKAVGGDDIYWKRRLAKALHLDRKYHEDWDGVVAKLNYKALSDRVHELLREREATTGTHGVPPGVTGYDITYSYQSLFGLHANLATIGGHIVYGEEEWAASAESHTGDTDVLKTPVLHTAHLAQYVLRAFGLDGEPLDEFVASLLVTAPPDTTAGV